MNRIVLYLLTIFCLSPSLALADYQNGVKAFNSGNFEQAFKEFLTEAEKGNADAQNDVGVMYSLGRGVVLDRAKAAEWFRKAADQGHAPAQNNLGKSYFKGLGVDQDYSKAIQWYEKAADQGNAQAQYNLGLMYYDGVGVTQDFSKAMVLFRKARIRGSQSLSNLESRISIKKKIENICMSINPSQHRLNSTLGLGYNDI